MKFTTILFIATLAIASALPQEWNPDQEQALDKLREWSNGKKKQEEQQKALETVRGWASAMKKPSV